MAVRAGYKQTDVGGIPEDWNRVLLDSVTKRGSGHTPSKSYPEYWGGDIKWVSLQDSDRLDRLFIEDTAVNISSLGLKNSSAVMHKAGTVVMSRDAGVGKSAIIATDMAVSQHFISWTCKKTISNYFLFYWLQSQKDEFERIAMGSTIKTLGLPFFQQLKISLPPTKAEQEAIAEALSDADGLIESLELLIAKKRQLKQGAMQELLTGKRRLPGFSGKWEEKNLGELFEFSGGVTASRAQLSSDGYCYLHYGDIHGSIKSFVDVESDFLNIPKLNIPLNKVSNSSLLKNGDVVFVDASEDSEGVCKHVIVKNSNNIPFISGLHTIVAKSKDESIDPEYRKYCFQTSQVKAQFLFYAAGAKVSGISKQNIKKIKVIFPKEAEQTAIASILSDMDAEIEQLEQKLTKARKMKQGMMQELLTGRIRLV